jgi:hypothetical protein
MRNRAFERSRRRSLRIGVDPLLVPGGVGKTVDLVLGYLHPVGGTEPLADQFQQIGRLF